MFQFPANHLFFELLAVIFFVTRNCLCSFVFYRVVVELPDIRYIRDAADVLVVSEFHVCQATEETMWKRGRWAGNDSRQSLIWGNMIKFVFSKSIATRVSLHPEPFHPRVFEETRGRVHAITLQVLLQEGSLPVS